MTGAISVAWCLVWFLLASDSPEKSRLISEEEREYIVKRREYDSFSDKDDIPMIPLLV